MIRSLTLALLVVTALVAPNCSVALQTETPQPDQQTAESPESIQEFTAESLTEKASYLMGYFYAQGLKADSIDIDIAQFMHGMKDGTQGNSPPMSDEEIRAVQTAFEKAVVKKQNEMIARAADENQREGAEFMKKNALVEGVKELENGVQYSVLTSGEGSENPRLTDRVKIHHTGKFVDGTVFVSTLDGAPIAGSVGAMGRGYASAIQQMKVGDKWTVFIPGDLAFGSTNYPPEIGPNRTLIYELELVEIIK